MEGTPPPDRDAVLSGWRASGWPGELEPHLRLLLRYENARRALGDVAVDGDAGPPLEWPRSWGRWALANHRVTVEIHLREMERIRLAERAASGG